MSFNHLASSSLYLTNLVSSLLVWLRLITSIFDEIQLKYVPMGMNWVYKSEFILDFFSSTQAADRPSLGLDGINVLAGLAR